MPTREEIEFNRRIGDFQNQVTAGGGIIPPGGITPEQRAAIKAQEARKAQVQSRPAVVGGVAPVQQPPEAQAARRGIPAIGSPEALRLTAGTNGIRSRIAEIGSDISDGLGNFFAGNPASAGAPEPAAEPVSAIAPPLEPASAIAPPPIPQLAPAPPVVNAGERGKNIIQRALPETDAAIRRTFEDAGAIGAQYDASDRSLANANKTVAGSIGRGVRGGLDTVLGFGKDTLGRAAGGLVDAATSFLLPDTAVADIAGRGPQTPAELSSADGQGARENKISQPVGSATDANGNTRDTEIAGPPQFQEGDDGPSVPEGQIEIIRGLKRSLVDQETGRIERPVGDTRAQQIFNQGGVSRAESIELAATEADAQARQTAANNSGQLVQRTVNGQQISSIARVGADGKTSFTDLGPVITPLSDRREVVKLKTETVGGEKGEDIAIVDKVSAEVLFNSGDPNVQKLAQGFADDEYQSIIAEAANFVGDGGSAEDYTNAISLSLQRAREQKAKRDPEE